MGEQRRSGQAGHRIKGGMWRFPAVNARCRPPEQPPCTRDQDLPAQAVTGRGSLQPSHQLVGTQVTFPKGNLSSLSIFLKISSFLCSERIIEATACGVIRPVHLEGLIAWGGPTLPADSTRAGLKIVAPQLLAGRTRVTEPRGLFHNKVL